MIRPDEERMFRIVIIVQHHLNEVIPPIIASEVGISILKIYELDIIRNILLFL